MEATDQFQKEIEAVVKRWAEESDLSAATMLGVLTIVEHEIFQGTFESEEPGEPGEIISEP